MQSIGEYLRHITNQIRDKRNREKVFNMAAVKKTVSLLISEPLLKKHVEKMFDLSNNRNFLFPPTTVKLPYHKGQHSFKVP